MISDYDYQYQPSAKTKELRNARKARTKAPTKLNSYGTKNKQTNPKINKSNNKAKKERNGDKE